MKINKIDQMYMRNCTVYLNMLSTLFDGYYCVFTNCSKCPLYWSFPKQYIEWRKNRYEDNSCTP